MWNKIKSKIKSIFMSEKENADVKITKPNSNQILDPNKKTYRFEIGDNVYWIFWWTGIFILMFFEKC
jgi:hypothetical protein